MLTARPLANRLVALLTLASAPILAAVDSLDPFPPPAAGQTRYAITLDARPDEDLHRVELLVGRTMEVDCNRRHFVGALDTEVVQGWGYTYHVVRDVRGPAGTLMACPEDSHRRAFVPLGGGPHWVRYNSRLPVVVYVPEGFEVRYRLWSAGQEIVAAEPR